MPYGDIVFITNRNEFFHSDAFDGHEYAFPPGEKVQVPTDAAIHMLGFGLADKTDTLVRLGWASRYNPQTKRMEEDPDGVAKLARFVFTRAVMIEEQVISPTEERAPMSASELAQMRPLDKGKKGQASEMDLA